MSIGTNHQLLRVVAGAIARATGRRYQIDLSRLDDQSLREFARLLRDLEDEKQIAINRARRFFWQRS